MLWFLICGILILISVTLFYICKKRNESDYSNLSCIKYFFYITSIIVTFVVFICFLCNNESTKIDAQVMKEEYAGLNYKIEALNNGMADDFGINNSDIMSEIITYNKTVSKFYSQKESLWTNWFVSDLVNDLNIIDYNNVKFNN